MHTLLSTVDHIAHHVPDLDEATRAQLAAGAEMLAEVWPAGHLHSYCDIEYDAPWRAPVPIRRHGFDLLCAGGERVVFFHETGDWCLKVPRIEGCERANRRELEALARVDKADRSLFATTVALPGDILLQRVYRIDPERFWRASLEISRAQLRLNVPDIHPGNVGWDAEGRWHFIDWAGARQREWSYEPDLD